MAVKISLTTIQEMGRIVQFHRRQARLSRIGLAEIAGVGKTVVFDIENGKKTVRLNTLLKVLEALNVSISLDGPLMDRYKAGEDAQG
jgi:transcriptional regulator with XRE-family HTH domain